MTWIDYLKKSDLTETLMRYVLHCISMTEGCVPALEVLLTFASSFMTCYICYCGILQGLQAAKLFLNSLGRFDNAPFLYPVFGGGELPQAFCRYDIQHA